MSRRNASQSGRMSSFRSRTGIGFVGAAYQQSFVLADVRMTWRLPTDEVMGFFSPEGLVIVAPLPGERHRIVATVDEAPEQPGLNDVQAIMDTRGPERDPAHVTEIVWSSRFRVHHRLADRYRAGRILLAGDAAHVHSPVGGQGMNTGIQDAMALGSVLTEILVGGAAESRLDLYEQLRRPVAERVVSVTHRMTRMATVRSRRGRMMRNVALGLAGRIPAMPRMIATELAGLRWR